MTDGEISLAQSYDPYGTVTYTAGTSSTAYGFTGETMDANGLIYLRARYYNPADARFISRDTWAGDVNSPLSLNRWMYVEGNPVNLVDPVGHEGIPPWAERYVLEYLKELRAKTEQCYLDGDTQCVYDNYYRLAQGGAVFGYHHASKHLFNYLDKGPDINYSSSLWGPSSRWVFEDRLIRRPLRQITKEMWRRIHAKVLTGVTNDHVITGEIPAKYPEGPTDTWYALGDFFVYVEADYEVTGCDVTVKPTYHFRDDYNWEPNLQAGGGIGGLAGFEDNWAASLKPVYAKEYKITGNWDGPDKIYNFNSAWFVDWPAGKNTYISWEYTNWFAERMDIFHFDD
jgi:RHS repeat-associated protein